MQNLFCFLLAIASFGLLEAKVIYQQGDVLITNDGVTFRCNNLICPTGTDLCQVSKVKYLDKNYLERYNECRSSKYGIVRKSYDKEPAENVDRAHFVVITDRDLKKYELDYCAVYEDCGLNTTVPAPPTNDPNVPPTVPTTTTIAPPEVIFEEGEVLITYDGVTFRCDRIMCDSSANKCTVKKVKHPDNDYLERWNECGGVQRYYKERAGNVERTNFIVITTQTYVEVSEDMCAIFSHCGFESTTLVTPTTTGRPLTTAFLKKDIAH